MADPFSIAISSAALAVSAATAWLTLFRRGTVRMTQPTLIFFGPDGEPVTTDHPTAAKVYLRTLLYATSKRGRIVESMFARLRRGETSQTFSIWVYGEDSLARGSGLFVGENGVVCNHHFLLPADGTTFRFLPGEYTLEVFATLAGSRRTLRLATIRLQLPGSLSAQISEHGTGVFFDWGPDSQHYHAHIRSREQVRLPRFLLNSVAPANAPEQDPAPPA